MSVEAAIKEYPAASGKCAEVARKIVPVAKEHDATAVPRVLRPSEGYFVTPKIKGVGRWFHHVATHVSMHFVDALTGADGEADATYLTKNWQHPDALVWTDADLDDETL